MDRGRSSLVHYIMKYERQGLSRHSRADHVFVHVTTPPCQELPRLQGELPRVAQAPRARHFLAVGGEFHLFFSLE